MSKTPEYMICENPMEDQREYVLRLAPPSFLAVVELDTIKPVRWFGEPPQDVQTMARLMRETGDWYASYCEWEDNGLDSQRLN